MVSLEKNADTCNCCLCSFSFTKSQVKLIITFENPSKYVESPVTHVKFIHRKSRHVKMI
jgi:hypothetical protein